MIQNDAPFKILKRKEIYEFLEGSGPSLIKYKGTDYGMPYCSGNRLEQICTEFGYTDFSPASRWNYVEGLVDFSIQNGRMDELLKFFFSIERFDELRSLTSDEEIDTVYESIVTAALSYINWCIRLTKKELVFASDHFYIVDTGTVPVIESPMLDKFSSKYVIDLRERCKSDFLAGNFDSVITKSRTLIEEVLVRILEDYGCTNIPKGEIIKQYNQVKNLFGMQQTKGYDGRVNCLLGSLETIVQSIAEMRNINSDAHGVGNKRIEIHEREAQLVLSSAIIFCEYMISIHGSPKRQ